METIQALSPSASVIPEYEKELTEADEKRVTAVMSVLNKNSVTDELVRARILAKHKAFISEVFIAGVEAGIL
jgi:hypothetical protein